MYENRFRGDYKRAFHQAANELLKVNMPLPWRNKAVKDLCDAYIEQTGEVPDSQQLERLADYILQDDLSNRMPDKVSRTDYPFFSKGQMKLRLKRERATGDLNSYFTLSKKYKMNGRRKVNKIYEA